MSYIYKDNHFKSYDQLAYFIYCKDHNLEYIEKILNKKELKSVLKFIYSRYGRSGLSKYRDKTEKDFKRKVIEVKNIAHIETLKNKNIKLHYKCKECNKDVYTSYSTYIRFQDFLCKNCRKSPKGNL